LGPGPLWDYRACVWDYRESTWTLDRDLVGYAVEVTDDRVGTVARATSAPIGRYVVVDIEKCCGGPRIVPARMVAALRHEDRVLRLDLTRQQLEDAPANDDASWSDALLAELEAYYATLG